MAGLKISIDEWQTRTLELLCYLMTSARGVIHEQRLYSPLRLAEGARRLILLMEEAGVADPEWHSIAERIERSRERWMTDEDACKQVLDELILQLTELLRKREL